MYMYSDMPEEFCRRHTDKSAYSIPEGRLSVGADTVWKAPCAVVSISTSGFHITKMYQK